MSKLCNVQIHINGQETFFLNERVLSSYSEKLRKIVKQERKKTQKKTIIMTSIEIDDFPGGPEGFELVTRLFHCNNGDDHITVTVTVTNVALLYSCAKFLGSTNLLQKTESFLEGMFYWSWKDVICCLKSCDSLFAHVDSNGLLERLILALLPKIAQTSDSFAAATSSSSSSSPETTTPSSKSWWFDDLTILPPKTVERVVAVVLGNSGSSSSSSSNNRLALTKFVLHYLKTVSANRRDRVAKSKWKSEFLSLADMAVHGVISSGREAFSCRSLFWVLRVLSGLGISRESRLELERRIGEALDESKLDDLLVCGNNTNGCGVYDVNLVIRLVRVFVNTNSDDEYNNKLRKVGRLVDKYLGEISPDHTLKVSKFLGVAQSVPDSARDSFDGVYTAIDIYLESHPNLSSDERSKLCQCLNYQKLSLEACKELAKNPKIPPRITMQALISQQSKVVTKNSCGDQDRHRPSPINSINPKLATYNGYCDSESYVEQSEDVKMNLQRMQTRVVELEKVCKEMKGQMSRMVRQNNVFGTPTHSKALPRLC